MKYISTGTKGYKAIELSTEQVNRITSHANITAHWYDEEEMKKWYMQEGYKLARIDATIQGNWWNWDGEFHPSMLIACALSGVGYNVCEEGLPPCIETSAEYKLCASIFVVVKK